MEIKKLKEITYLFNDKEYLLLGHGTGRRSESSEIIESIFSTGLRTKDNSLYYTTMGLETNNIDDLIYKLNNWPHLNSKKIILIRLPIEYININGESSDLDGEKFGAFTYPKANDGKITYYLDPKFIIGCYDASTGIVTLNDKFEKELSLKSIETLKKKYLECVQKTKRRNEVLGDALISLSLSSSSYNDIEMPDFDFDGPKNL